MQAASTDISADSVCQNAKIASFGADMASSVIGKGNDALSTLRESAMACDNLTSGKDLALEASQLFKGVQQSRKLAANGARRAKQECQKAKRTTSRSMLEQRLTKAVKFANDSMEAARSARARYSEIKDIPGSSICAGSVAKSKDDDNGSSGGTQERETSLRLWLVRLANMLYDKLPEEIIKSYGWSPTPDGCQLEGFKIEIAIDAFDRPCGADYWIKNRAECIKI